MVNVGSECNDVSINFYPLKYLTTKNKAQSLAKKPFNWQFKSLYLSCKDWVNDWEFLLACGGKPCHPGSPPACSEAASCNSS